MDETISEFFSHDHCRLDELFADFQRLKTTDRPEAAKRLGQFRSGLQRHMTWEETILFFALEDRLGPGESSPTEKLRLDHHVILDQLDRIEAALASPATDGNEAEARLLSVLDDHNRLEESALYAQLDAQLTAPERAALLARVND